MAKSFHFAGLAKGWITDDIFKSYIRKIFIPAIEERRKDLKEGDNARALLLVDSHGSRNQESVIQLLREHKIDMLTMPPHSSHLLQPLDRLILSLFKSKLWKLMHEYQMENGTAE